MSLSFVSPLASYLTTPLSAPLCAPLLKPLATPLTKPLAKPLAYTAVGAANDLFLTLIQSLAIIQKSGILPEMKWPKDHGEQIGAEGILEF